MSDSTDVRRHSTTYYGKSVEKFIIDLDSDGSEEEDSDFEDDGQSEIDLEEIGEHIPYPPSTSHNLAITSNAPSLPTSTTPASHQPGLACLVQDFRVALESKRPVHEVAAAEDRILQHLHNIPVTVADVKELMIFTPCRDAPCHGTSSQFRPPNSLLSQFTAI